MGYSYLSWESWIKVVVIVHYQQSRRQSVSQSVRPARSGLSVDRSVGGWVDRWVGQTVGRSLDQSFVP